MALRPDLKPLDPGFVVENLRNLRRPTLDLDSVYGDGPAFWGHQSQDAGFYDGARFRIGRNHVEGTPGEKIPPDVDDLGRDLPRIGELLAAGLIKEDDFTQEQRDDPNFRTRALIGDARNDENLVIGQLHLAFLRFHNRVVEQLESARGGHSLSFGFGHRRQMNLFETARRLVRWHHQWLVVNDYLKTVTTAGMVDKVLLGGPKFYEPRNGQLYMPLEYSVAAFRFGHSMVRGAYDYNRNFGKRLPGQGAGQPLIPSASLELLFAFTGNGHAPNRATGTIEPSPFLKQGPTLPFNWVIEWDRFTNKGSADPSHFARKIDTHLTPPLLDLVNEGNTAGIDAGIRALLKQLAARNLTRGYLLHMPTGQAMANALGVPAMTEAELRQGNSDAVNAVLDQGGFIQTTPLWYYLLKEAEVRANGHTLGELGSRILCETIIGLLRCDRSSYLNQRGWSPADGVRMENGNPIVTISDFLRFAGVMI